MLVSRDSKVTVVHVEELESLANKELTVSRDLVAKKEKKETVDYKDLLVFQETEVYQDQLV